MTILLLRAGCSCEAELVLMSQAGWLEFCLLGHTWIWVQMLETVMLSGLDWEDRSSSGMNLRWLG